MSGESNFIDYEPLRNERREKSFADDDQGLRKGHAPGLPESEGFSRTTEEAVGADEAFPANRGLRTKPTLETGQRIELENSPPSTTRVRNETNSLGRLALKSGHLLSYAGVFIFTFFVFFRPYEWSSALSWLSRGALITAIVTLIIFVPTQLGLENTLTLRTREVNLVLVLLGLGLLSVPFAVDKLLAWNSFVEFLKVVAIFIVMVNVLRNEGRLRKLLLLVLVASCILSILAINDYRSGNLVLGGRITGAIGGIFENPNDLALHLVTFFPMVVALALAARNPFTRLIYFIAALTLLGGTVVTFSRGGFIGLIFVIGALFWRLFGKNRILVIGGTVVLVGVFLVLAGGAYRERIATTGDASAEARTGELKRSIYVALRNPLVGVGMDNFVIFSNTSHATHNAYTQVASEMGIPAAVVYVLFLITTLKRMKKIPHPVKMNRRDRSLGYLAIGVQAGLVGYTVTSFFASVAYLWYVYYLAAYAICIWRFWEAQETIPTSTSEITPGLI